ncbi:Gfo/Idh/MocA family oxidoreductase [Paenibacillus sp. GSMTC-2017]|uniref:Gfo/Idh/MocA family protein n=1 Tax=Paenibacillus sp. GSMTC-2017 TaxID=2794350 RepID=UPI0018D7F28B|nr:Gfo/Idh/MocA family oxidoreductase [Paenibacillus sp. GSMTC-2017]MBH5320229.1 Gfo/Idh/MocA family oxidoreductase [Paenibacillus sp. GSMTC-2017]
MLKIGLIGFGFMGRMHVDNYIRLISEGVQIQLTAICDLRIEELKLGSAWGNIVTEHDVYDLSPYHLYDDIEEMLKNEELDIVDISLPTHLHAELAISLLQRGIHVLCEKPIARTSDEAWRMVEAARHSSKTLMIGHCLRFWPAYEYLKSCVSDGRYGKVLSGQFFRGGASPQGWFLDGEQSGGCMLDMHIHDTDIINWLFGMPESVSTIARNVIPGSGYDIVSTNYIYPDGKVLQASADWTLQGDNGLTMMFRVNFEGGNLVFDYNRLKVYPNAERGFFATLSRDKGYYREISYFIEAVRNGTKVSVCSPESTAQSLEIIEAEVRSAANRGAIEVINGKIQEVKQQS